MIITLASAKGGVGKSTLSVNIAWWLSQKYRVLVYDSDAGSSCMPILFQREPKGYMTDFIRGEHTLDEVKTSFSPTLDFIASPNGLTNITEDDMRRVGQAILEEKAKYDYVIIDTPAGVHANTIQMFNISDKVFIIINMEPVSIADNYRLIKLMRMSKINCSIYLLCNKISDIPSAVRRFAGINKQLAGSELDPILYAGNIGKSTIIERAILENKIFLQTHPTSSIARQLVGMITEKLV